MDELNELGAYSVDFMHCARDLLIHNPDITPEMVVNIGASKTLEANRLNEQLRREGM